MFNIQNHSKMGMTVTRRKDTRTPRVFMHKTADIRGGVSVKVSELGGDFLNEGAVLSAPDNGICHVVKIAVLQANAFIAMMMIGMMFEPAGDKALLRETVRELLGRYLFAAVSAALVFFCTPFELVVRQTLCIVCFAPLSSLAPIYTDRCHGDTALASFTNSVSIAVSLVIMLALGLGFVL